MKYAEYLSIHIGTAAPCQPRGHRLTVSCRELVPQNRFREACAIDRDERMVIAAARQVYRTGNEFFPRAGFALDQHGRIDYGNFRYATVQLSHGGTFADQIEEPSAVDQPTFKLLSFLLGFEPAVRFMTHCSATPKPQLE